MTKQVLINGSATTLGSTITGLTNMQLGTFTPAGVAATTGAQDFIIAQGAPAGRNPRISPVIKKGSVSSFTKKVGVAVTPSVINVGYAGSGTLNLNVTTNGLYEVKLMNMTPLAPPFSNHTSVIPTSTWATSLQISTVIADALAKDLNAYLLLNQSIAGGQYAFVDVLSDLTLATAAASGTSVTFSVVNGSSTLVITDTVALTNGTALTAGNWLRIGGSADTNPIYQIASVVVTSGTVTTVTLTRPFVGTTNTATAIANLKVASATNVLPTSSSLAGLKITSTGNWFETNTWAPGKPNGPLAVIAAQNLAGTPVVLTTPFAPGFNTLSQVVGLEYSYLSALGIGNRGTFPYPNDFYAEAAVAQAGQTNGLFTVYEIAYSPSFSDKSAQAIARENELALYIAIPNSVTVTNFEGYVAALTGVTLVTL